VQWDAGISETMRFVIGDAQTSGGLLVATPDGPALLKALTAAGVEGAGIGEVVSEDPQGTIEMAP